MEYLPEPNTALTDYPADDAPTITITRDQLECWVGRKLTDEEVRDIDNAVPDSTIPDAIADIADQLPN